MFLGNLFKIYRGTVAGDNTGTPARPAAEGINSNMDAIDNALEQINNNAEKVDNKATNLDAPDNVTFPTTQAAAIAIDAAKQTAQNYADSQLSAYQNKNEKGVANGYADLDENAKVPAAQTYATIDEIIEGAYVDATTFNDDLGNPVTPGSAKLYQDTTTGNANSGKQYRWSGTMFSNIPSSPGTTDEVPEGGVNKYFTGARVLQTLLSGFAVGTATVVTAGDSIAGALGKLQGQINALVTSIGNKLDKAGYTGTAQSLYEFANTKETPLGSQAKADAALQASIDYANSLNGADIFVENFSDLSAYTLEEDINYCVRSENTIYWYDDLTGLLYPTRITAAQFALKANDAEVVKAVAANGTTYNRDANGLVDLGTIAGVGSGSPIISGIETITTNYTLQVSDKDKIKRVKDYAIIEIPTGLGLKFRTVIKKRTNKTVSFVGIDENIIIETPPEMVAQIMSENDYVELILEEIDNGIEYWGIAGALLPHDTNYDIILGSYVALSTSQTSVPSLYWARIHKSSDWPEITTTKDYFVLYSTVHSAGQGGIFWGECDDVEYKGFVERGVVVSGYQAETPWLYRGSDATKPIYISYHTLSEPGHTVSQETRLIKTSGGVLHEAVWTDLGRPITLESGWNHTGYNVVFKNDSNLYIAMHLTTQGSSNYAISTSSDGEVFTFLKMLDINANMPVGTTFGWNNIRPFKYNAIQYGIIETRHDNSRFLTVATLNANFEPTGIVQDLYEFPNMTTFMTIIRDGWIYTSLVEASEEDEPVRVYKYKLSNIQ